MGKILKLLYKPEEVINELASNVIGGKHFLLLFAISIAYGVMEYLDESTNIIVGVIGSFIGVIIFIGIYSSLVRLVGKWLGGRADFGKVFTTQVYMALASIILNISMTLLIILAVAVFGKTVVLVNTVKILLFVLKIYILHIGIKAIAAIQGFSYWRGALNSTLFFVPIILVIVIGLIATVVMPQASQIHRMGEEANRMQQFQIGTMGEEANNQMNQFQIGTRSNDE